MKLRKTIHQTNEAFIEEWERSAYIEPLREAHDLLSHFIPGYQITGIVSERGTIRFRYVIPIDMEDVQLYRSLANHIVGWCEHRCGIIGIGEMLADAVPEPEEEEE